MRTFHNWGGHVFIVDIQPVGPLLGFVAIGWDFLVIISIRFGNGFRKSCLFGIIFLPYWGNPTDDDLLLFFFPY